MSQPSGSPSQPHLPEQNGGDGARVAEGGRRLRAFEPLLPVTYWYIQALIHLIMYIPLPLDNGVLLCAPT